MAKKIMVWIYEYRDDDSPLGATFYEGFLDDISDSISLPHLGGDWHWRIDVNYVTVDD